MKFWGAYIEPRKPYKLRLDDRPLLLSQATLGVCSRKWNSKSVIKCAVGGQPPVAMCSLCNKIHCCSLDLVFEAPDDIVFSVAGPYGIYIAGYYLGKSTATDEHGVYLSCSTLSKMEFWGAFIEPGKPCTLRLDNRRVRLSQATLGVRRLLKSRSIVQCAIGSQPPILICSLSNELHCCSMDLEFEERDDIVFSVDGPRGIHVAGYYLPSRGTSSKSIAIDELRVDFCRKNISSGACKRNTKLMSSKLALQENVAFDDDSSSDGKDLMRQYVTSDDADIKEDMLNIEQQECQKSNQSLPMTGCQVIQDNYVATLKSIGCIEHGDKHEIQNDFIPRSREIKEKTKAAGERAGNTIASELLEKTEVHITCRARSNKKTDHVIVSTEKEGCPTERKRRKKGIMQDIPVYGSSGTSINNIVTDCGLKEDALKTMKDGNCPPAIIGCLKSITGDSPTKKKRRKKEIILSLPVDGSRTCFSNIAADCGFKEDAPKAMNEGNCPPAIIGCQISVTRKASNKSSQLVTEMCHSRERKNAKKRKN